VIRTFRQLLVLAFAGSVLLPLVTVIASSGGFSGIFVTDLQPTLVVYLSMVLGCCVAVMKFGDRLFHLLVRESLDQGKFVDSISESRIPIAIAASAALSLVLELAVIRWHASMFEFFAFYKNFSLLACFAGLGIGYALSKSREGVSLCLTIPLLAWQMMLLTFLRYGFARWQTSSIQVVPFREQLHMGLMQSSRLGFTAIYVLLTVVFILTVLTFLPVGQLCGRLMERRRKLESYGFNVLGSLLGVLLMFLVSFIWAPPVIWFSVACLALVFFVVRQEKSLLFTASAAVIVLTVLAWPVNPLWNRVYSPYQMLELGYGERGLLMIRAAGHYYQRVHNFADGSVKESVNPQTVRVRNYYELPYRIFGSPRDVAIVGAGTGNDVAAALRVGARSVDAIEIDPAILAAGKMNHPEQPYGNPRVRALVNDARSFFRNTDRQYDVVVYGLLDSHTLLSNSSSVRLDSFVYTVEGIREARSRLKENGLLSLSFSVIDDALATKIFRMMQEAFDGKGPICINSGYDGAINFIQAKNGGLIISPELLVASGFVDRSMHYSSSTTSVDVSTDDWPFLYMPHRVFPVSYMPMLGLVALLSILLYLKFFGEAPRFSQAPFFFLGAGFMLIETKAITELGLTFGNTWQVVAVAITGILIMSFLSNAFVMRFRIGSALWLHFLILASLVVGWWVAKTGGLPSTTMGRVETVLLLTCPVFFSGLVFSSLLAAESNISGVMAVNLLGAMFGGILEYSSMYFGLRFLYLLAVGLYGMSFVCASLQKAGAVVRVPAD
jgi:SAM-dependent methyltransferase